MLTLMVEFPMATCSSTSEMSLTDDIDVVSDAEIADDEFKETTDSQQMSTSSGNQQQSRAGSPGETLIEQLQQALKAPANRKRKTSDTNHLVVLVSRNL